MGRLLTTSPNSVSLYDGRNGLEDGVMSPRSQQSGCGVGFRYLLSQFLVTSRVHPLARLIALHIIKGLESVMSCFSGVRLQE
jgi:hypothetical protein